MRTRTYPRNLAPTGPNSRTRLARASPSMRGGGWGVRCGRTYLHVILVGLGAHLGGTMTRTPECLQPLMAPPLASTRNETRKLRKNEINPLTSLWVSMCLLFPVQLPFESIIKIANFLYYRRTPMSLKKTYPIWIGCRLMSTLSGVYLLMYSE